MHGNGIHTIDQPMKLAASIAIVPAAAESYLMTLFATRQPRLPIVFTTIRPVMSNAETMLVHQRLERRSRGRDQGQSQCHRRHQNNSRSGPVLSPSLSTGTPTRPSIETYRLLIGVPC